MSISTRRGRAASPAWVLAALAASALVATGCGDEEEDTGESAAAPAQVEISAPAAEDQPLEVPPSVHAGVVELTLDNTGERPADAQLIRVEGDHSAQEALEVLGGAQRGGPLPDWFLAGGGVGVTPPGETRSATQIMEPGTYYAFNTSVRGQPAEPEPIEVTGDPAGAELSTAPGTITASEYTFESEGLTAGTEEITFENAGEQPHHVIAAPLEEGATLEDVERFFETEEGRPPVDFERQVDTAVVEGGDTQVVPLALDSGEYALVCFISDREGGPPHVAKGMIATAQVE